MNLYRFQWDVGRMGDVEGIFVADPAEVRASLGGAVYFGEILGKHSEVYGSLDIEDLEIIEATDAFVIEFKELFPQGFGHNPLENITKYCDECGEEIEEVDCPCLDVDESV